MAIGKAVLAAFVCLVVGGCTVSGGGAPARYSAPRDSDESPSIDNLSGGVKAALKEGCRNRYGDNDRKYRECISGDRHSEDALIDGCNRRYSGNKDKLRDCLRSAF